MAGLRLRSASPLRSAPLFPIAFVIIFLLCGAKKEMEEGLVVVCGLAHGYCTMVLLRHPYTGKLLFVLYLIGRVNNQIRNMIS